MPSDPRHRWWRLDALILVVLALAAEAVLRFAAPEYGMHLFDRDFTGGYAMDVNDDDYRGPRLALAKAAGERRLLALGDSITFGTGVPGEAAWPARAAALARRRGRPVTVVNAGVEGAALRDLRRGYAQKWAAYAPDQVFLAITGNMVSLEVAATDAPPRLPADAFAALRSPQSSAQQLRAAANRIVHRSCLWSFLSVRSQTALYWLGLLTHNVDAKAPYGAVLALGWQQGDLAPQLARTAWERLGAELAGLRDDVRAGGGALLVTFVAPRFTLTDGLVDNEKNVPRDRLTLDGAAETARLATRLGVPFVDAMAALRAARARIARDERRFAPLYIQADYAHLDEDGHAALAAALDAATAVTPTH